MSSLVYLLVWSPPPHIPYILHPISVFFLQHMPIPSLSSLLGTLSFTLTLHIHLIMFISVHWSATSFSFLTGQVSLPCSILLRTQLLYSLPLLINDIFLLVSNGTNCLNLFHPIRILASTAASAPPSTLNISHKINKKLKPGLVASYDIWHGNRFQCFTCYLLT